MKTTLRLVLSVATLAALLGLGGCFAGMSRLDKNAAISPLTGGIPGETRMIGGPATGGRAGIETERPK